LISYAVDLGTTNIKVALYDDALRQLALARAPMRYRREQAIVEFDPEEVFQTVLGLIAECTTQVGLRSVDEASIAITGQAESLVLLDAAGKPLGPGISWMDERSTEEAAEIAERFGVEQAFAVTGEPEPGPTWPATKLRWLAKHQPQTLASARRVLMIKDYLLYRLTGALVGEETTRGFTYLYDVPAGKYWSPMLDFCGVDEASLPELVPAGTQLGPVLPAVAERLPQARYTVNCGALDHFCAMVGTGCYLPGTVSASAGTVLSLSLLAGDWEFQPEALVSFHRGIAPDDIVLFTCADSGGICLDWYQQLVGELPCSELEAELPARGYDDAPLFLPYLTGVNPPDFDASARGGFLGLGLRHDRFDLGYAVMEGVAHLLRRNLDYLAGFGHRASTVVSSGGGTASGFWNQLKADVCGLGFRTCAEPEAACRGAAVLSLVSAGVIGSVNDTAGLQLPETTEYHPQHTPRHQARYRDFEDCLNRLYGSAPANPPTQLPPAR
jgi:xylulokinase